MSIKKEYMTITHEVTEQICVKQIQVCDICGKEIHKEYWLITTHHNDWGNDSCESYECFDACSPECAYSMFIGYLDDTKNKWNSKCFDVEHHCIA